MAKTLSGFVVEGLMTATFPVAITVTGERKIDEDEIKRRGLEALSSDPDMAEVSFEIVAITDAAGNLVMGSFSPDEGDDEDGEGEPPEVDFSNVRPMRRK